MRLLVLTLLLLRPLTGDDGSQLWLRYEALPETRRVEVAGHFSALCLPAETASAQAAARELQRGLDGLLARSIPTVETVTQPGVLVVGTPASSPLIARAGLEEELAELGPEGFLIRSTRIDGHPATLLAAGSDPGVLRGAFALLRLLQNGETVDDLDHAERPRFRYRLLNHWDNLDGSVERGYAGRSLWDWDALPGEVDPRLVDYARANASLGINGSVLNNVNADARSLTPAYLAKAAAIADTFRPYGIRVFLSARFSAPIELGGLPQADPLDPAVAAWWKDKAEEIHRLIPDFGGFLVKANSEGQPGPLSYGRSHADGANMLAAALAPHGGIVMWRAFVYDPEPGSDRIAQAYDAMKPLDGSFADNVLLQVKNGPLDFQPREPFHPLFGGLRDTAVMPELQVTQEYLGHDRQLAFLAPMWREFLDADTHAEGPGSTVLRSVDGSLSERELTGIAGVANTGSDRNWTGHPLAQANWYAFGRLAWDPDLDSATLAREWVRQTLTRDPAVVETVVRLLLESREAVVDYSMPLGLTHLMWEGHHYGPQPWCDHLGRPDWNPYYFHRSDRDGIGFDRTAQGSNALSQYHPGARQHWADPDSCPEEFLLWFHRLPWDHPMKSGRSLWEELCHHYQRGVDWTRDARRRWEELAEAIDPGIHREVADRLATQERDAVRWRDACLLYFQSHADRPFPEGIDAPVHTLHDLKSQDPLVPGDG